MNPYWLIGLSGAALIVATFALMAMMRLSVSLKTSQAHERWLQGQLERVENEQGSIEAVLAGLGRHMDGFDQKLVLQLQRLEHMETRFESLATQDDGDRSFGHALRLSAQGRVTLQELVNDFGLSESEAQLLLRINNPS
ncbi:DUF2802 domain-containing protein [Halothiobacillus sp.]|uniref:DUF2802 domain-containing protein n=1 Tax=Halothiobacillus sp. TaxID=1891311 RepID=UPI002AD43B45|nr:DUF2802 domain-containing protein [Halothiobacillus sp.]